MFAIVEYTAQRDGAVRDYNIRKVFAERDYEKCLGYFQATMPKKNWQLTSSGWAMYRKDIAADWTDWRKLEEIPDPD